MLNLDLQRAEVALKAGRLEDVVNLLDRGNLRAHRRGQSLIDRLVEALIRRGCGHFDAGRLTAAQADAEIAAGLAGRTPDATALLEKVDQRLGKSADDAIESLLRDAELAYRSGRLDRLIAMERDVGSARNPSRLTTELLEQIKRCREISQSLHDGNYREVEGHLNVLSRYYEDDGWVNETLGIIAQITSPLEQLRSGPLGLITNPSRTMSSLTAHHRPRDGVVDAPALGRNGFSASVNSCLLHVDGLGSLVLLLGPRVTIGGTGRSTECDVMLQTDSVESPLVIRRDGDDYLASCDTPFRLNETATNQALLASNDLLRIGRRGRMRFRKPVAASSSATIQLTAAGTARGDVRHIVLMSDSLLFGPGGCHFSVDGLSKGVVLSVVDGKFMVRTLGEKDSAMELAMNQSVVSEGIRFGLKEIA